MIRIILFYKKYYKEKNYKFFYSKNYYYNLEKTFHNRGYIYVFRIL
ncbi:hypothetical protein M8044_000157 [Columbia Basin potato purple top phytoplasma]|uniref:Uncharacterized protein n=1 Tax=Columbia Basin potato purple top phytoplasma TaxID=307134 RepID=A0ABT5LB67_9MOLU|nr:hypothetical protein [Columbia Basin potato purple top phytoplasma]